MTYKGDIIVQESDGRLIAIVEIKNRQNLSRDIAMMLRRSMIDDGLPLNIPYFLLLSEDTGFLWKQPDQAKPEASPTVEFPMKNIVTRYLPELGPEERLRGAELELLVLHWLNNLAWTPQIPNEEPEKSLAASGFLETIQGAIVLIETQPQPYL